MSFGGQARLVRNGRAQNRGLGAVLEGQGMPEKETFWEESLWCVWKDCSEANASIL